MIDDLVSSPQIKMLEQTMSFTEKRHTVLLEDIANVSTPGYIQKDVSVAEFQKSLQDALSKMQQSNTNDYEPESGETVKFESDSSQVDATPVDTVTGPVFHDKGARQMEYLMGEMADNATAHNMVAQMLKSRYDQIGRAISMKI